MRRWESTLRVLDLQRYGTSTTHDHDHTTTTLEPGDIVFDAETGPKLLSHAFMHAAIVLHARPNMMTHTSHRPTDRKRPPEFLVADFGILRDSKTTISASVGTWSVHDATTARVSFTDQGGSRQSLGESGALYFVPTQQWMSQAHLQNKDLHELKERISDVALLIMYTVTHTEAPTTMRDVAALCFKSCEFVDQEISSLMIEYTSIVGEGKGYNLNQLLVCSGFVVFSLQLGFYTYLKERNAHDEKEITMLMKEALPVNRSCRPRQVQTQLTNSGMWIKRDLKVKRDSQEDDLKGMQRKLGHTWFQEIMRKRGEWTNKARAKAPAETVAETVAENVASWLATPKAAQDEGVPISWKRELVWLKFTKLNPDRIRIEKSQGVFIEYVRFPDGTRKYINRDDAYELSINSSEADTWNQTKVTWKNEQILVSLFIRDSTASTLTDDEPNM